MIKEYTKKDGSKAYMFRMYLGIDPITGKQRGTTRRGFKTVREAKLAYSRLQLEVDEEGFKSQNKTTYSELFELWYDTVYINTVKESTRVKTKELFKNHILPAMGNKRVDSITIRQCQMMVNEWYGQLKNFKTVKNYALRVLDYAVTLELIRDNPMKKVVMPKHKEKVAHEEQSGNFYSKDELQTFLTCCKEDLSYDWYAFFRLLAFSGFRKGEAMALTWKDINFTDQTITINKTLANGENNRLIIQPPKSRSSNRKISLDAITLGILKEWRKQQAIEMFKHGYNTRNESQLVFTNTKNTYMQPSKTRKVMLSVIKKNDLQTVTVHGLRHTHCSLLFESGAPIQVVKERLGHADIQTTMNIYAHVTQKSKEDTAERFSKYVNF